MHLFKLINIKVSNFFLSGQLTQNLKILLFRQTVKRQIVNFW